MATNDVPEVEYRKVDTDFAVAGQILPDQVAMIASAGFKTIICNRPDGEEPNQPGYQLIADAAKEAGLDFHYIPVVREGMTYENVDATKAALAEAQEPIFAYCRSGARSTQLYQFVKQQDG
ncbi:MAG: TIGR01244 family sulfur transferase [Pseudomonadota bacterium]